MRSPTTNTLKIVCFCFLTLSFCLFHGTYSFRLRLPVHVATEMGQLGVLRTFVHYDICNLFASDGKSFGNVETFSARDRYDQFQK